MEFSKEDIKKYAELLGQAEEFRPLVKLVFEIIKSYSSEVKGLLEPLSEWITGNRIKTIEMYETAGFSRDDAIIMTLDDIYALKKASEKFGNRNKSNK